VTNSVTVSYSSNPDPMLSHFFRQERAALFRNIGQRDVETLDPDCSANFLNPTLRRRRRLNSRRFETLEDAINFLVTNLDADDFETIADECRDAAMDTQRTSAGFDSPRLYRLRAIQELGRRQAIRSLLSIYTDRQFPPDTDAFTLGGHDKELGHIHIDFVRDETSWQLKEIWICR
jgi:hypothetical protein